MREIMNYDYVADMLRELARITRGKDKLLTYLIEMALLCCEQRMAAGAAAKSSARQRFWSQGLRR